MTNVADPEHERIDLSDLDGTEYQKLIFESLLHNLFGDPRILKVENHMQGAVDYIVREHPEKGMLDAERVHYFECKNYSRPLSLDNVAKIMVVAVAEQPSTVHVVSRTKLQPQIKKYASRIFNVDSAGAPIFKGIVFRHWLTEEVGVFKKTDFADEDEPEIVRRSEVWWWVSECSAFSETEIASSCAPYREMPVRQGRLIVLTLELPDPAPASVELLGIPRPCWSPIASDQGDGSGEKRSFVIDTGGLESNGIYAVYVRMVCGVADTRLPISRFHVKPVDIYLPELRSEEIERLCGEVGPAGQFRLVLVDGEAGVGKTHLIERIAETLRAKASFDVMRFTLSEENCESLMGSLLRGCLTPPVERRAFLELADIVRGELQVQAGGGSVEADVSLLARMASCLGPRIIVLRDCQFITPGVADQIWTLIMALDDSSWGGVRFILEYRQPDAQANGALQTLIRKIRLKVRSVLLERRVSPLDDKQFAALAQGLFSDVTDDLARCLWQRTGGLPLFIDSYLRRLLSLGLISREFGPAPFSIGKPAQVFADTLPVNGQLILEERVQIWSRDAFGDHRDHRVVETGLLAMAVDSRGQSLVREALGLSLEDVRILQTALDDGEIGYGRPDGQIMFRHDLLQSAVISVAAACEGFALRALELACKLLEHGECGERVLVHALRVKIFALIGDKVALETELRIGAAAAEEACDYGWLVSFLTQLLSLLEERASVSERLDFMERLAWASWVSDSLLIARERYLQLAEEAERCMDGDFSQAEGVATDAYRRAIGIDLELVELQPFIGNARRVLGRRQTPITFNSILNRFVLFCARFGYPRLGYDFSRLAFEHVGDGKRENEGSVLCSELGELYSPSAPETARELFECALALAMDDRERSYNTLQIMIIRALHLGREVDLNDFGHLWKICSQNRFSETLARASLLRGSLFLRAGDLTNAANWISRTSTMVRLYHLRQFRLAVLNDQVLLSLMQGNRDNTLTQFADMLAEYEWIEGQLDGLSPFVIQAYEDSVKAAATLPRQPSSIPRPDGPPEYCDPMSEMRGNVSALAPILGMGEAVKRPIDPLRRPHTVHVSRHRKVMVGAMTLVLGAY